MCITTPTEVDLFCKNITITEVNSEPYMYTSNQLDGYNTSTSPFSKTKGENSFL